MLEGDNKIAALKVQEGGSHYKNMQVQPVEFIFLNRLPFIEGNIIKYISRWRNKNGVEDLKKARHFVHLLMDFEAVDLVSQSTGFGSDKRVQVLLNKAAEYNSANKIPLFDAAIITGVFVWREAGQEGNLKSAIDYINYLINVEAPKLGMRNG